VKTGESRASTRKLGVALILWALPPAVSGIFITFSVDHGPEVGMVGLAILALGTAFARGWALWSIVNLGATWRFANGLAASGSTVVGIVALVALTQPFGLGLLVMLVASWAVFLTVCDAVMAFRIRHVQLSRDLGVLAIASGALATIEIVFPLSSVYAVGILGAYGVIVAVYLAIAGASLRFDSSSHIASKEGSTS